MNEAAPRRWSRPVGMRLLRMRLQQGELKPGDKRYCCPLTVTDDRSRYLLACGGVVSTRSAFAVFERAFRAFGLPRTIRIKRIKPGHPRQNGRRERMHPTLKQKTAKPAAFNVPQQ